MSYHIYAAGLYLYYNYQIFGFIDYSFGIDGYYSVLLWNHDFIVYTLYCQHCVCDVLVSGCM